MKRRFFWIIILLLLPVGLMSRKNVEVSDRAMVHAVGIDSSGDEYTVTLQIFKSDGSGGETVIDPSKPNMMAISNTADTIDRAMKLCEDQLGEHLFIGHNRIIAIGSEVSLEDPQELLRYFIDSRENYLGVDIILAENTARELLEVPLTIGSVSAENFSKALSICRDNGEAPPCDMLHFLNSAGSGDNTAVLPVVTIRESADTGSSGGDPEEDTQSAIQLIKIDSCAVISGGERIGEISSAEIAALNWLTGQMKTNTLTIESGGSRLGVTVKNRGTRIGLKERDGSLIFTADITAEIFNGNVLSGAGEGDDIKAKTAEEIWNSCRDFAEKAYGEYDSDVLGILRLIRFYYPDIYLKYKEDPGRLKELTDFEINVTVK